MKNLDLGSIFYIFLLQFILKSLYIKKVVFMAFVVTESCIKCKYTDCVEVCPVDCFYEGPDFLVIHPDECIDCALCEPECPIDAIYSEDELPSDQIEFIEINARLSDVYENITQAKEPLPTAEEYKDIKNKKELIDF